MKRSLAHLFITAWILLSWIGSPSVVGSPSAQGRPAVGILETGFPVVPIPLLVRRIPQFFSEALPEHLPYSHIEAFINNERKDPWHEVVLTERASGKQIYYCNSQRTVDLLSHFGQEAYFSPIEFDDSQTAHPNSTFSLQFHDNSGQMIRWNFAAGSPKFESSDPASFMARPDDDGFMLLHRNRTMAAAQGTSVLIGNDQSAPEQSAFYATDVLMVKIQPTTEQWNIAAAPAQLQVGGKWILRDSTSRERLITIQRIEGDKVLLNMEDPGEPNSPPVHLEVRQASNQFTLRSLAIDLNPHSFRISFDPGLPLLAAQVNDKTDVGFTMDEDGHNGIAAGRLLAVRGLMDENLTWEFSVPDWARSLQLTTGVNILVSSGPPGIMKRP